MANSVWDQIKAASGIREHTVEEVREAVNRAVEAASPFRTSVMEQVESLSADGREATLANSVVGVDDVPRESTSPAFVPEAGHEFEPEVQTRDEPVDDGPEF